MQGPAQVKTGPPHSPVPAALSDLSQTHTFTHRTSCSAVPSQAPWARPQTQDDTGEEGGYHRPSQVS